MAYTQAQINSVIREFKNGGMSDADIERLAPQYGVTGDQLIAARNDYYGIQPAPATTAPATNPTTGQPNLGSMSGLGDFLSGLSPQAQVSKPAYVAPTMPTLQSYTPSSYLPQLNATIQQQGTQNLQQNILPGISRSSAAAGGYGGSRQGVAEGIAAANTQTGIAAQQAQAAQQDYAQQTAQNLQRYGLELNAANQNAAQQNQFNLAGQQNQNAFNLGLGNLSLGLNNLGLGYYNAANNYDLGVTNATNSFYGQQRGQDLQALALGSSLAGAGNAGYLGQGQGIQGIGAAQNQGYWDVLNNASNLFNQYSGLGGSTVGTQTGSTLGNAAGGALAGAQLGKLWGGSDGGWGSWNSTATSNNNYANSLEMANRLQAQGTTPYGL